MIDGSGSLALGTPRSAIPPRLPYLVAACAPSAKFAVYIDPKVGEAFLATSSDCATLGPGSKLSTSWSDLQQHLTELKLQLYPMVGQSKQMGALSMLSALRELGICCAMPPEQFESSPFWDMSRESLTLNLPNLVSLELGHLEHGEVVLSCPKLTEAFFGTTKSFRIKVDDAALERLVLDSCGRVQCVLHSPEEQLQSLRTLLVSGCSEEGQHLIERLPQMRRLQKLKYLNFPAARMPTDFPQGLRKVRLCPIDCRHELPEGLKGLRKLTRISFNSDCRFWDITRPLAEFLPLSGLREVTLSGKVYMSGGKWMQTVF